MDQQQNSMTVQSEETMESPAPKKGLPKKLPMILIPVAAAVVVVGGIGIGVSANTPKAIAGGALNDLRNTITDIELVSAINGMLEGGRMSVTVGEDSGLWSSFVGGATTGLFGEVKVDVWSDLSKSESAVRANVADSDFALYFSNSDLVFDSDVLGKAYGLSMPTLTEDVLNWSVVKEAIEASVIDKEELETCLDQITAMTKKGEKTIKTGNSLVDKYEKLTLDLLFKHAKVEKENGTDGKVVTLTIDSDTLSKTVRDLWKTAAKDKKLKEYLDANFSTEMIRTMVGDSASFSYDDWSDIFSDSDIIDDFCDELDKFNGEIELEVTASSVAHKFKKLKLTVEVEDGRSSVTLDRTEKGKTSFTVKSGSQTLLSAVLSEKEDGYKLKVSAVGEEILSASLSLDKKEGSYRLSITVDGDDELQVRGKYEITKKRFFVSVDKATVGNDSLTVALSLEIVPREKAPTAPQYTKLTELGSSDFEEMGVKVTEWAMKKFPELIIGLVPGIPGVTTPEFSLPDFDFETFEDDDLNGKGPDDSWSWWTSPESGVTEPGTAEPTFPDETFPDDEDCLIAAAVGEDAVKALIGDATNLSEEYFDAISSLSVYGGFDYTNSEDIPEAGTTEDAPNLFDRDTSTKWCCEDAKAEHVSSVVWSMTQQVTATHYSITTANDNETYTGRNPDGWRIYATNKDLDDSMKMDENFFDNDEVPEGWVLITQVGTTDMPDLNCTECGFKIDKPGAYKHYMFLLDWTAMGSGTFQFSEITLYGAAG